MNEPTVLNPATKLYRFTDGPVVERAGRKYVVRGAGWDELFNDPDLPSRLDQAVERGDEINASSLGRMLAPMLVGLAVNYRSIGTNAGVLYSTGNASISSGSQPCGRSWPEASRMPRGPKRAPAR